MPKTHPLYRGNPAITILRIFLWLMPAILIPVVIFLGVAANHYLPVPASISLSLLLFVAATAGIGHFEQLLTYQEMRTPPATSKGELVRWTITFVFVQILIAPIILGAALGIFGAFASYFA